MITAGKKINAVFSVTNCICYDQRILKMADVLEKMNTDITIVGRKKGQCCDRKLVPYKTVRFKMLFKKNFFFYMFFNIRLFFWLLFNKSDLLIANDLDTLLPNFIVSKIKKIPLVYDSHEYFTGSPEIINRNLVRFVWKSIEKLCFPNLKYVITVNERIAELYKNEYNIMPLVVRNYAYSSEDIKPFIREELNIPVSDFVLIIQGTGINIEMGGEELIEAMKYTENVTLIVMGSGDIVPVMKKKAAEYNILDKIKFIDPLPWKEMMRYTKTADAGLILLKDISLNYRFSLPNKLFDYISAGIPVITSNLPLINDIIVKYNCGIILPEVTPEEISEAIKMLSGNTILLRQLKNNSSAASRELKWEQESEKVRRFYQKIFKTEISQIIDN